MNRNRCSKTGKFLPQKGGMFAPGTFANLGNAMLHPEGAARQPSESDSSSDDEEEQQLERIRAILSRLPPPYAGGGWGSQKNRPRNIQMNLRKNDILVNEEAPKRFQFSKLNRFPIDELHLEHIGLRLSKRKPPPLLSAWSCPTWKSNTEMPFWHQDTEHLLSYRFPTFLIQTCSLTATGIVFFRFNDTILL